MFIVNFMRYLRGYITFKAWGTYVERFLNLASQNQIPIWNGSRQGNVFTGRTFAAGYRKLRHYARQTGTRLRLAEKHGAPFKRRKYRRRTGLLIGLCVFFGFVFLTSQFIWRVEVSGNRLIHESEILSALEELGAKPGVLRASIDVRGSERRMMLAMDKISWVAINIKGSAIYVEIREYDTQPKVMDASGPCNLVASHTGQIISMTVTEGEPFKAIGDTVLKGDVLVSGITQTRLGQNSFKHAQAKVTAEVEHFIEVTAPLEQTVYQETGQIATRRFLRVFMWDFPLFPPVGIAKPYHVERVFEPFTVLGRKLSMGVYTERYHLMRAVDMSYSADEGKILALRELAAREKAELADAEVLERNVTAKVKPETVTLIARYICRLDIAEEKPILLHSDGV